MPTETLQSQVSTIFPSDATLVANIISALTSTWNSADHQELLSGLSGGVQKSTLRNSRLLGSNTEPLDAGKAVKAGGPITSFSYSEQSSLMNATNVRSDLYSRFQSSPTFQSLSSAYNPSVVFKTKSYHSAFGTPACVPAIATINLDDQSKPEALLARVIIALSAMRHSTARKGWVTSIASGALRYKVGVSGGENMVRKLMEYEGGTVRIE